MVGVGLVCEHRNHLVSEVYSRITSTNPNDCIAANIVTKYVEKHSKSQHAKFLQSTQIKFRDEMLLRRTLSRRKKLPAPPIPAALVKVTAHIIPPTNIVNVRSPETLISTSACKSPVSIVNDDVSFCVVPPLTPLRPNHRSQQTDNKTSRTSCLSGLHSEMPRYRPPQLRERKIIRQVSMSYDQPNNQRTVIPILIKPLMTVVIPQNHVVEIRNHLKQNSRNHDPRNTTYRIKPLMSIIVFSK